LHVQFRLSSLLVATVAVAAAAGYGARASRYVQSLLAEGDTGRAAVIVFAALLTLVPLAFILAVRLGQLAIGSRRPEPKQKSQLAEDDQMAESHTDENATLNHASQRPSMR
jgi:hypothetical protein